ncbi:MAG: NYN domain-containing protein [Promethearchaeia archaeon]
MDKIILIIDGSNVALFKRNQKKEALIANFHILLKYLKEIKQEYHIGWEILIDASLRYQIDDKEQLEKFIKTGIIVQCPNGIEADIFILEYYRRHPKNTFIISNDNFKEYKMSDLKLLKFAIVKGEFICPELPKML